MEGFADENGQIVSALTILRAKYDDLLNDLASRAHVVILAYAPQDYEELLNCIAQTVIEYREKHLDAEDCRIIIAVSRNAEIFFSSSNHSQARAALSESVLRNEAKCYWSDVVAAAIGKDVAEMLVAKGLGPMFP